MTTKRMRTTAVLSAVACVITVFLPASILAAQDDSNSAYLKAVRTFADNVLQHGRDVYGPKHTPLFADGINIDTHKPALWELPAEYVKSWNMPSTWVMSNLASQQNFFRVLVALTELTGDAKYKQAAVDATRYALENLRHEEGLLFWGGHAAWDLATEQGVGEGRTGPLAGKHELKSNYPFYELMWEVDQQATRKFIEAFWSNHILRWDILDMNRHGHYQPISETLWQDEYIGGPVPFVGKGLTFMNTGSDLFYAGAMLYELTGDEQPLRWAKNLAKRYVDSRHPVTGLGAHNYSVLESHRIQKQFEPEFGDRITEATIASLYGRRYNRIAISQLKISERLGSPGEQFKQWGIEDLTACAKYQYDPADNRFWATIIDGTKLTPADRKRDGYVELRWLEKREADSLDLWAYALAYKLSRDPLMWQMTRNIASGFKLGDIGSTPDETPSLDLSTSNSDANTIFALLELHQATGKKEYLTLARRIGDNLLEAQFQKGFFVDSKDHLYCKFDTVTPLALLYLEAAVKGLPVKLPLYSAGKSYFHCTFDGEGRTYDHHLIYTRLRKPETSANRSTGPDSPTDMPGEVYKQVGDTALKVFIFNPPGHKPADKRPAIVFFFGGGWSNGSPEQFVEQCRYLSSRGMVALTAEYRVSSRHNAKVVDCVADAQSAIRWVRANAKRLGIDPDKIAAGGGSAGGHLAAATGTLEDFAAADEDKSISSRPNAMVLFNPVLDLTPEGFGKRENLKRRDNFKKRLGADGRKLSPTYHITTGTPPAIIFHGKNDTTVPYAQAEAFTKAMQEAGNRCELIGFEGEGHGFFNYARKNRKTFVATMRQADEFLTSLKYLVGKPTIDVFRGQ